MEDYTNIEKCTQLMFGRINIVRMTTVLKAIYMIPIKIPKLFFRDQNDPKFCMEPQKIQINLSNIEKEQSW